MLSADSGHGLNFLSNDGTGAASRADKQKYASKNGINSDPPKGTKYHQHGHTVKYHTSDNCAKKHDKTEITWSSFLEALYASLAFRKTKLSSS